jgi:glycine/sarcosine N-methyltransferase
MWYTKYILPESIEENRRKKMGSLYDRAEIYDLLEDDTRYSWYFKHWQKIFSGKEISTMLDVSIGSGSMTLPVLDMGITLSGSDLSEHMLERCVKKAETRGHSIFTLQSDFRQVSEKFRKTFDCVASSGNSLGYVSNADVEKTLEEMDRLIKPGGYLYLDTRNWEKILREHQRFYLYNPVYHGEDRINLTQVWDYPPDGSIIFNLLFTFERDGKIFQKEIFEEKYQPFQNHLIFDTLKKLGYDNAEIYPCPAVGEEKPLKELDWYAVIAKKRL